MVENFQGFLFIFFFNKTERLTTSAEYSHEVNGTISWSFFSGFSRETENIFAPGKKKKTWIQ